MRYLKNVTAKAHAILGGLLGQSAKAEIAATDGRAYRRNPKRGRVVGKAELPVKLTRQLRRQQARLAMKGRELI